MQNVLENREFPRFVIYSDRTHTDDFEHIGADSNDIVGAIDHRSVLKEFLLIRKHLTICSTIKNPQCLCRRAVQQLLRNGCIGDNSESSAVNRCPTRTPIAVPSRIPIPRVFLLCDPCPTFILPMPRFTTMMTFTLLLLPSLFRRTRTGLSLPLLCIVCCNRSNGIGPNI